MTDLISREALERRCKGSYLTPDDFRFEIRNAPAIEQEAVGYVSGLPIKTPQAIRRDANDVFKYPLYSTPQQPQEQDELVKKTVADALEEAAKICDDLEYKNNRFDCAGCGDAIRALIKRNVVKEGE